MNMRNSKSQETWFCRHLGSVNHTSDTYSEVNYSDALFGILVLLTVTMLNFLSSFLQYAMVPPHFYHES